MAPTDFWVGPEAQPDTYRLVSMLGGGGEGEVWQAVLPLSAEGRSHVAVKVLRPVPGADEGQWQQFGHLLRSLSHPGLVRVTDVFTGPGVHREGAADPRTRANYVVMDYIEGPTLREWCDENPDATAGQRLRMLRMVASALDEMHSGSHTQVAVAHGDVKPSNVVVRDGSGTVLVDLGLARLADAAGVVGRSAPYAAPELRAPGRMATPEADCFAFAVTTAQILTGQLPPTGADGWLDRPALESLLRASPVTARRPMLIRQILHVLDAPPEARPRDLRTWLDSAADTLSQVTTGSPTTPDASLSSYPPPGGAFAAASTSGHDPAAATQVIEVSAVAPLRRRRWPLVLVAALLLIVAGIGAGLLLRPPTNPALVAAPPTSTTNATATSAPPSPTAVSPTATAAPSGSAVAAASTQYLTTLNAVESDSQSSTGTYETGTATMDGTTYNRSIRMSAGCQNNDGGDYWVDYSIGRQWTTLTGAVGISDGSSANSKATYALIGDGKTIVTGPLQLGVRVPLSVSVAGILRLRLQINDPNAPKRFCGVSDQRTSVVWADPAVNGPSA